MFSVGVHLSVSGEDKVFGSVTVEEERANQNWFGSPHLLLSLARMCVV